MISHSSSWQIRGNVDNNAIPGLNFSPVFTSLLKLRGMSTSDDAMRFISPRLNDMKDPASMSGIETACARIADAITKKERIGVFTDYDVDGVCSAALLYRFFIKLGIPAPLVFIPDRSFDGYGLNTRGIDVLHGQGATLIITADCGINSCSEVNYAKSLGIDVIITDHHEPEGKLPETFSIINPKQENCPFYGEDLCGAGVVFHMIIALRAYLRKLGFENLPNLREDLDLVAMATVADVVSLSGVNRILIKEGLVVINSQGRPGIAALAKVSGINREVFAHDLGYILGPRINAAGRMSDASKAFELLTTDDEGTANLIASELHLLNQKRQAEELKVLKEAISMVEARPHLPKVIVVAGTNWHTGVVGIVASRLSERYLRPTVVISINNATGKGSGRSVEGVDLHAAINECSHLLIGNGGHKMAVGLTIEADKIIQFASSLETIVSKILPSESKIEVDMKIFPSDITPGLLKELEMLSPYGDGNPEPVFMMSGMEVISTKKLEGSQIKLMLQHSGRVFHTLGYTVNGNGNSLSKKLDIAFSPVQRRFNGHNYLYLALKALSPA
jgi:single-stranded-DNA-specific exonuclease